MYWTFHGKWDKITEEVIDLKMGNLVRFTSLEIVFSKLSLSDFWLKNILICVIDLVYEGGVPGIIRKAWNAQIEPKFNF